MNLPTAPSRILSGPRYRIRRDPARWPVVSPTATSVRIRVVRPAKAFGCRRWSIASTTRATFSARPTTTTKCTSYVRGTATIHLKGRRQCHRPQAQAEESSRCTNATAASTLRSDRPRSSGRQLKYEENCRGCRACPSAAERTMTMKTQRNQPVRKSATCRWTPTTPRRRLCTPRAGDPAPL